MASLYQFLHEWSLREWTAQVEIEVPISPGAEEGAWCSVQ